MNNFVEAVSIFRHPEVVEFIANELTRVPYSPQARTYLRTLLKELLRINSDQSIHLLVDRKNQLAANVDDAWAVLGAALFQKGEYPKKEFYAFFDAVIEYNNAIKRNRLIHRSIAGMISKLVETLEMERKRVPEGILMDADRMECIIFAGYDPYFECDEPLGY
ncbi:MAG: hypothetical protein P4L36_00075 [Holophaga sp.]|nr:hypothetical protein [Holophaga sp.]